MEVLDNGGHSENKSSGGNYSCRLSRDIAIGSSASAHNRGETNVQLLLACKAQLSSEVIRLKTETLCLQKERDATRSRMKELDQMLVKMTDRAREFENRLCVAEDENKRLRGRVLSMSNTSALQKLSVSLDKFHSYPWSENRPPNPHTSSSPFSSSTGNTLELKKAPVLSPQEDWKDVSQKLLEQMRQEMRELQEMSSNFSARESSSDSAVEVTPKNSDSHIDGDDDVEESLSLLQSEMESLKLSLFKQHKTLKSLMNDVMQGNVYLPTGDISSSESKAFDSNAADKSTKSKSFPSQISRHSDSFRAFFTKQLEGCQISSHSDDSFRAFFTKQLEGCQNVDKTSRTTQFFLNSNVPNLSKPSSSTTSPKATIPHAEVGKKTSDRKPAEEERVCPICQAPFDVSIPQKEFEEHVLDHLEVESASLLDQYVVL